MCVCSEFVVPPYYIELDAGRCFRLGAFPDSYHVHRSLEYGGSDLRYINQGGVSDNDIKSRHIDDYRSGLLHCHKYRVNGHSDCLRPMWRCADLHSCFLRYIY